VDWLGVAVFCGVELGARVGLSVDDGTGCRVGVADGVETGAQPVRTTIIKILSNRKNRILPYSLNRRL